MFTFSEIDLAKYKGVVPPWGPVGQIVYNRTYSRPIYKDGVIESRENWLQTCARVIEGNMNLMENDPTATREWAVKALDLMFNMAWLPPGRGLWMMGTEYSKKRGGDALNNCWYVNIRPYSYEDMDMFKDTYVFSDPHKDMPSFPFVFMFDRAMLGGGVGFSVAEENISQFPLVDTNVEIDFLLNESHPDVQRISPVIEEHITLYKNSDDVIHSSNTVIIRVKDSREGWSTAVRELIDAHYSGNGMARIAFDMSDIREYGALIRGFGGTASGCLPLVEAMLAINKILNLRFGEKIQSTDGLDIMNILGRCVVSGNVRRTALIALGDPGDEDYVNAKNYKLTLPVLELDEHGFPIWEEDETGKFGQKQKPYDQCVGELGKEETDRLLDLAWRMENHRWASNNTVYTDNLFEDFHFLASGIIANGEPGICNKWLIRNYGRIIDGYQEGVDKDADGLNPCFTGDMKLLTEEGYRTFEELVGTTPRLVNKDGNVTEGIVWCSGEKDTIEVKNTKGGVITCTPNHIFMTINEEEIEAQHLKGERIMPFFRKEGNHSVLYQELGFVQGDGQLSQLDTVRNGIEVNVGRNDNDVYKLFNSPELYADGRRFYYVGNNDLMKELGFSEQISPLRELPTSFNGWKKQDKLSFLRGLYSANGSVLKKGRITFKTTSFKLSGQLLEVLSELGLTAYRTENKPRETEWHNGTYTSANSYDVNIQDYYSRMEFYTHIGFIQRYKEEVLVETLMANSPMIVSIKPNGIEKVYDFTEPETHWGVVEGVIAHNCGEITLANAENCNLVEFVPYRCLELGIPMEEVIEIATQYSYRITFANYMWKATQRIIEKNRRIGVSFSGVQDYFLSKYGHYALDHFEDGDITKPVFHEDIVKEVLGWYDVVDKTNKEHARLVGSVESIKKTTVKPSGTISKLPGVSAGLHFHYAPYLIQRIRFHETDPNLPVLERCGYHIEPDFKTPNTMVVQFPIKAPNADNPNFRSSGDVSIEEQIANQYLFAYAWADNAVSATITFKQDETDKIEPLLRAYRDKIKSTSLLPYSGHGYTQAPWEPTTKENYESMVSSLKMSLSDGYASGALLEDSEIFEDDCESGACPIR